MSSRGKGARLKGANFERRVANDLTEAMESFGYTFKRGLGQTRGGGAETADVICDSLPLLHIECKNQKVCNIKAAMVQAMNDIGESARVPIVVTRDTGKDTLVTMRWNDWVGLFKDSIGLNP